MTPLPEPGTVLVQGIVPWCQINTTQHQTARALAALGWTVLYLDPRCGLTRFQAVEPRRPEVTVLSERVPWLPGRVAARLAPGWRLPLGRLRGLPGPLWLYRTAGPERHLWWGRTLEELVRPDAVSLEIWDRLGPRAADALAATTSRGTVVWTVHPAMSAACGECPVVPNAAGPAVRPAAGLGVEPRLGYVGSINPWFASELVAAAVERLPGVTCEIVGAPWGLRGPERDAWRRLLRLPGARWLGPLPYDEAMARVATWRAGLLPRNAAPGAQESDPLKALDYFACGVPCVTSHRGTHERFPDVTFFGASPEAFAAAAERALATGLGLTEACRRVAGVWTWRARAEHLVRLVLGHEPRDPPVPPPPAFHPHPRP